MATPMDLSGCCILCYEPHDGGVWGLVGPYEAVLVNVCIPCRMWEIASLARFRSAYEGNGHPDGCACLECPTHFGTGE